MPSPTFPFSFWKAGVPPQVTSITPNIGFVDGNKSVTIVGMGFSVSPPTVTINGSPCTSVAVIDDTHLTAVTGASSRNALSNVSVTTTGGTSVPNTLWEYFDPANPPGASATCFCYLNSRHVTTIAGPLVSAASDQSGNGNNAACQPGFEIPYIASDTNFAGYPSINQLNGVNAGALVVPSNPLGAVNQSYCMVGFGIPTASQNYRWNLNGNTQCVSIAPNTNVAVDSNTVTNQIVWTNTDATLSPGCITTTLDGTPASTLAVSAKTRITGNAGILTNNAGTNMSIGERGGGNTTQGLNGPWTDWLQFSGLLSVSDDQYIQVGFGKIYVYTVNP